AGERVTIIVRAALDLPPRLPRAGAMGLEAPAGIERLEHDGVAGIDRQHRRSVAREVPVQRAFVRLERVDHRDPGPYPPLRTAARAPASVRGVEFSRELRGDVLAGDITL